MKSFHEKRFDRVADMMWKYDLNYGKITIKETPRFLIIEFYTGGWSVNEELLAELRMKATPQIDDGTITIYSFNKGLLSRACYTMFNTMKCKSYTYRFVRK